MAGTASDELVIPDEGLLADELAIPPDEAAELRIPDEDSVGSAAEVIFDEGEPAPAPPPPPAPPPAPGTTPSDDLVDAFIARKKEKLARSARSPAVTSASQRAQEAHQDATVERGSSDRTRREEEWTELELKRQLKGLMDEVHAREIEDFRATHPKEAPAPTPPPPDVSLARSSRRRRGGTSSTRGVNPNKGSSNGLASTRRTPVAAPSARQSPSPPSPPSTRALRRSGTRRHVARPGTQGGATLLIPLLVGVSLFAALVVFLALK